MLVQKIQKYEDGTNRVGASGLQQIADALHSQSGFSKQGSAQPATTGGTRRVAPDIAAFLAERLAPNLGRRFVRWRRRSGARPSNGHGSHRPPGRGLNRSRTVTPSAPAIDSRVIKVGLAFMRSMSEMSPCRSSPACAASCSCDHVRCRRSLRTLYASAARSGRPVPLAIDKDGSLWASFIYTFKRIGLDICGR
jgi:hypothetical protein